MIDRRTALGPLLAVLVTGGVLVSFAACGSTSREDAVVSDAGDEPDAEAPPAPPPRAYPPGPYGTSIGDVIDDFTVLGYPFTPSQRDRTRLPFREVHLSEAITPGCTCLAIVLNAAGSQCGYCVNAHLAWANTVLSDPSLCAMEVIWQDYDGVGAGVGGSPPTRADLDALTSTGEPFPVGLATSSAVRATSPSSFYAIPNHLIVRTSDMRIVDHIAGFSPGVSAGVKAACKAPSPPVEHVADGLTPRRLRLGKTAAFVSDWHDGIVRVDLPQGAPQTLATPAGLPDALAVDDTHVYWATHEGAGPFEIARVPQAGGPSEQLATSTSGFTSIAVDDARVWFTRADGVVGSVAKTGGPIVTLAASETTPESIVVDGTNAWWIANGIEVATAAKAGGARALIGKIPEQDAAPPGTLRQLFDLGPSLVVRASFALPAGNVNGDTALAGVGKIATGGNNLATPFVTAPGIVDIGAPYSQSRVPIADRQAESNRGIVGIVDVTNGGTTYLAVGQANVSSVTTDHDYIYWTVNADGLVPRGGGIRRTR